MSTGKPKIATVWLDGCSGCHMSLLDMDERLIALADKIDLVVSPLVDPKTFPAQVDVTLVEGAVSSIEDLHKIQLVRQRTTVLVALGDCAVTSNVPGMRNYFTIDQLLQRAYVENAAPDHQQLPSRFVPALRPQATPIHEVVDVDLFLPGCPPPADAIYELLSELLAGRVPDTNRLSHFGK